MILIPTSKKETYKDSNTYVSKDYILFWIKGSFKSYVQCNNLISS